MLLTTAPMLCIVAFVAVAFVLRVRMKRVKVLYETRLRTLLAAEIVLLEEGCSPQLDGVERQIDDAVKTSSVMRKHAALFRSLWPEEYDGAFYAAQRLIAQGGRVVALTERTVSSR